MFEVTTGLMITVAMGTEVSKVSIGRDTPAGGVGLGVGVGVSVPVIVMRPLFCVGTCEFRSASMKRKLCGSAAQTNGVVLPGVPLTLSILRLNSVPEQDSVMKWSEKANTRVVLIGPGP